MILREILDYNWAVKSIKEQNINFPFKIAYALLENEKRTTSISEVFESKRMEIIDKYFINNEKEERYCPEDKVEEFTAEINTLLLESVDVDLVKIDSKIMSDLDFEININILNALLVIFE